MTIVDNAQKSGQPFSRGNSCIRSALREYGAGVMGRAKNPSTAGVQLYLSQSSDLVTLGRHGGDAKRPHYIHVCRHEELAQT